MYEVVRSKTTFVLFWGVLVLELFTHHRRTARRCKLPTAARARLCCGDVAAGKPEPPVEVAQNGTPTKAHDFGDDCKQKR